MLRKARGPSFSLSSSSLSLQLIVDSSSSMATQDGVITLSTSDDPPALVKVSRNALIAHSRVFADMLSLNLESDRIDGAIPVEESKQEIFLLKQLIEGKETEGLHKVLSQGNWEMVAKLSDKYDCTFIRKMVEAKAW